ncbi:MAG: hypothetical protein WAM62_11385 [Pseudolabrys sp.]|jgi:hypothetical protein
MWISLFTVVLAISLGLGLGAMTLESYGDNARRYGRRRVRHF